MFIPTYTYTIIYTFAPKDIRQSINPSIYSISSETKILEYFYTSHLRGLASWRLEAGWLYMTLENREFQMFWTDFISGRKASEFGFCKLVSHHFWQIIRSHVGSIPTIHLKFLNMGTSEVFNFSRFGGWLMFLLRFFFPSLKYVVFEPKWCFLMVFFFELKKRSLPRYEKKNRL